MSPALNGSSAIRLSKHSNALEIHDGITFDFYTGLPHMNACMWSEQFELKLETHIQHYHIVSTLRRIVSKHLWQFLVSFACR